MNSWFKKIVLSMMVLVGLGGIALNSNDVFAESSYFDIDVTSSRYECTETDFSSGAPVGGCVAEGWVDNKKTVRIGNIDGKYTVDGKSKTTVHGGVVSFSVYGNDLVIDVKKLSEYGQMTAGTKEIKVPISNDTKAFRQAVADKIGKGSYDGGSGRKISFTVGKVDSSSSGNESADATAESTSTQSSGSKVEPTCENSGAANTLGWIVCPATDLLSKQLTEVYDGVVKPALEVEPQLFVDTGDSTRQGWETFRNFADIAFIILLLVVIFSQLTGVGIDNYGIKKILPKLIIAAILINLSYWLCVAFVDLSNILGNSFQAMFNGLGANISTTNEYAKKALEDSIAAGGATVVSVVIIAGLLAAVVAASALNPAVLLTILVAVLGVFISIFFLFILLSVRQAAIVVLVVLSPLAVVCYMLPNTKFLFDKWLKLFGALLLVYPICGLLIGGGNYVSKLLLAAGVADNGIFGAITSVVVGIVPIFFIPTVLRKSFSAMGQLGGKISSMGQTVSGAATKGIRGSTLYKGAQERGQERRTRIKAGYDRHGNRVTGFRAAGARAMNFGSKRSMQRNALRYRKNISEQGALAAADLPGFMDDVYTQQEMDRITASSEFNNFNDLQNGLRNALETDKAAQIRAYTNILANKGEKGRDAIKNAWNQANVSENGISNSAAATFGNNILNNHSSFKSDARSLFDTATNAAAGTRNDAGRFDNTNELSANSLAMSATSGSMASMDDAEFAQTFLGGNPENYEKNGSAIVSLSGDPAQQKAIGENAYNALKNAQNMKPDRVIYLRKIVDASGYTPPASTS